MVDIYEPGRQLWEVVGGVEKGGLVVRREAEKTSQPFPYRLTHGAWVQELARQGDRLHYQRLTGEGPDIGWVSLGAKVRGEEKAFLEPRAGPPPGRPPPKAAAAAPQPAAVQAAAAAAARGAAGQPPAAAVGPFVGWTGRYNDTLADPPPSNFRLPGQPSSWLPGGEATAGREQDSGRPRPKRGAKERGAPFGDVFNSSAVAGAVRETDYEVEFEVVHEKVMVRRSPSTKDALLGVVKEGALLRGTPYDVAGDPWLLLASDSCPEVDRHGRQGWVLINGRCVGLGELLRETTIRPGQEVSGGAADPMGPEDLLEQEARRRRLAAAKARGFPLEEKEAPAADEGDAAAAGGEAAKPDMISVAFWGICDIKYDPRQPKQDRVKVLELGDGKISRFSHHGRRILERYKKGYCMDEVPIKRSVMVENKKFTHDVFVRAGFPHLRPNTVSYERRYDPGLADRIIMDLKLMERMHPVTDDSAVVLKLCNRSRGAGICVVTASELDNVLKQLLTPPDEKELEDFLRDRAPGALRHDFATQFEETCLHWWTNECPLFVVEACCQSLPVAMSADSPERFDGTLRVAFALYRGAKTHKYEGARSIKPFEIDWLGGYWKLPRVPSAFEGAAAAPGEGGLEALHSRIVSSFNSREKRTAEVDDAHLQEVYDALTPALPRIFQTGSLGVQHILEAYSKNSLFRAFALSRAAAQMRVREMPKALNLYQRARDMVQSEVDVRNGAEDVPRRACLSYVERNVGVCHAMQGDWAGAGVCFQRALRLLPTNATAHYLLGCFWQEQGQWEDSAECQLRSLALDPDFKLPYLALGMARLMQERYPEAEEAARACLARHPDAPTALCTLGQAAYQRLHRGQVDDPKLFEEAKSALAAAKQREPKLWAEADEQVLRYFFSEASERTLLPRQPAHPWRSIGWRP